MKIRLPIDIKSLYFNIKNDNLTGHTATVATPLKQGASIHPELSRIREIPRNINAYSLDGICTKIISKSRADAKITDVFVFDKVSINNIDIECDSSFCIYIREEINPKNVHYGRQKIHYPPSLNFSDDYIDVNNKKVINCASEILKNYAFIVEGFEYDTETKKLNLDAIIVGENSIPYSKIFLNKKGMGTKFAAVFNEYADTYDAEIIALRERFGYDVVSPENYMEFQKQNKEISMNIIEKALIDKGAQRIRRLNDEYPYSLYDIQYYLNNKKKYIICCFTSTKIKYFNLTHNKIRFCNDFSDDVDVALVSSINTEPDVEWYSISDLNNMKKTINSITYSKGG